ncbi:MAG TPA: helix-turn-helix domain-containing protein [Albitalea sp.]|uniref:sigma-54-dependent Fis family transcriptional regulator n=1 Tax=Piscinibacter sp. TaxID=1903157 RepID=UPI002ED44B7E
MPASLIPAPGAAPDPLHARAIAESHERCRAFGLRVHEAPDLALVSRADLRQAREHNQRLCEQALPVMELLWEQLSHTRSMVVLSDRQGTVLHAVGDAGFLERAHRVALAPGAVWSEAAKGTNAVGTALMDEVPTLVHGREHYLGINHFLTCSAAPIFDHAGQVMGVIDVSGDQRSYHPHTLALARMSARLIEDQWFSDRFRHALKLHLHPQASALGTVQEGVMAIDADGQILGANRRALDLLARSAASLRRHSVATVFGVSAAQIVDHARQGGDAPMTLVPRPAVDASAPPARLPALPLWAGDPGELPSPRGLALAAPQALHAKVTLGAGEESRRPVRIGPPRATGVPTLREHERQAIADALSASGGNMSRAARALGIGRSTLYRKLRDIGDTP